MAGLVFLGMGLLQSLGAALRQLSFSRISESMVMRVRTVLGRTSPAAPL